MHKWRQQCRRQRRRLFCAANAAHCERHDFFSDVAKFISPLNRLVYFKGGREIAPQRQLLDAISRVCNFSRLLRPLDYGEDGIKEDFANL